MEAQLEKIREVQKEAWSKSSQGWKKWDEMVMTSEEIIDAGDHLIQAILFRGRGRGSGVEVEGRFFQVHTVKDGETVRWEEFADRAEALEAAGLSE